MKNLKFFLYGAVAVISITVIRCLQVTNLINPENGFFFDGMEGLGAALTAATLLIVAVGFLLGLFVKTEGIITSPKPNAFLGGAALLVGVAQLSEPIVGIAVSYEISPLLYILKLLFIGLSGVYFCYFGITMLLGNSPKSVFSVVPVACAVFRLVVTFISFTGMANISDNMYDILALTATMLFLLFYAKSLVGIKFKPGNQMLFSTGLIAVMLNTAAVLPRIIMTFLGVKQYEHIQSDSPISIMFITLYIAVYMLVISKNSVDSSKK